MQDQAFNCMGKGLCIIPSDGKVIAPCDGIITTFFPTGHACGLTSLQGAEILIHIGSETIQIGEDFFIKHKNQGDFVNKGDVLITYNLEVLKKKGYNSETAVIITNMNSYLDVIKMCDQEVEYLDEILIALKTESK